MLFYQLFMKHINGYDCGFVYFPFQFWQLLLDAFEDTLLSCKANLDILNSTSLAEIHMATISPHVLAYMFIFLITFFGRTSFQLWWGLIYLLPPLLWLELFVSCLKKSWPTSMFVKIFSNVYFSRSFTIWSFPFKSITYFELRFVGWVFSSVWFVKIPGVLAPFIEKTIFYRKATESLLFIYLRGGICWST